MKTDFTCRKFGENDGYDCMTCAITIGRAILDGAKYGQRTCEPITREQRMEMEADKTAKP
jgi:hypothetical protein